MLKVLNRVIMMYKLSSFLCEWMCREQIINEDEMELSEYGLQITMANIINFMLMFAIGFLFHSICEMLLFYVVFVSLRFFCGGYHADSYGKCFCMFALTCIVVMLGIEITEIQGRLQMIVLGVVTFVHFVCIYKWAPVEHVNRPATTEEKRNFRKKSFWISAAWAMIGMGLLYQQLYRFVTAIIYGFLLISLFMLIGNCEIQKLIDGDKFKN